MTNIFYIRTHTIKNKVHTHHCSYPTQQRFSVKNFFDPYFLFYDKVKRFVAPFFLNEEIFHNSLANE